MSEYTAEQVARKADLQEDHVADMLRDYAALLRERESAKAVVTDELAERVLNRYVNECISHLDEAPVHLRVTAMRVALEAVAPMLASQDQDPMHNDPRAESGDAEEIAQWLYANGYHVAAYTIRTQLDIRNKMLASATLPIPMILHCPSCGVQHIDAPDDTVSVHMDGRETVWDNPPHRSHLCHNCGTIWRPADVPTTGVEKIRTEGKNDVVMPAPMLAKPSELPVDHPSMKIGAWLSAALDDPTVCEDMKADVTEWFSAGKPMLASARVPERTSDMTKFVDGLGWVVRLSDVPEYTKRLIEQTRDLLATAPKPETEE